MNLSVDTLPISTKLPDWSNPATRAIEQKLGPFNYEHDSEYAGLELIERMP